MQLRPEDLRRFARRDWGAPERLARKERAALPLADKIRLSIELYEAARQLDPAWPGDAIRHADIDAHIRLRELLSRAAHVGTR